MLNSIDETQKLFKVEGIKEDGQRDVLNAQLADLRKDLVELKNPFLKGSIGEEGDIQVAQLEILIGVAEGLLSQI